jgi:hypothetical protein
LDVEGRKLRGIFVGAKKIVDFESVDLLTLKEVATKSRYHLKSIERFARLKIIRTVKIRGKRMVTATAYQEFLESGLEEGKLE